jgi:hypothetical protein
MTTDYVWSRGGTTPRVCGLGDTVGDLEVACECQHCAPHRAGTECGCDHPARWMVFFAHMVLNTCARPFALCDPCLEAAKAWAVQTASCAGDYEGGRCFMCGGGPIRCADDILTAVVPL